VAVSPEHLHFDGPMVAGGLGYPVDELLAAPAPPAFGTGVEWIDQLTGGIAPGAVWTVAGPTGVGVTTFAVRLAVASAHSGVVLVANGHVGSRALARQAAGVARCGQGGMPDGLRLASWLPVPDVGDDSWDGASESAAVVVLDTWDEMWRPARWQMSREERIADIRWLREVARGCGTAVVLTARLPNRAAGARPAPAHWAAEAFKDAADVAVELDWEAGAPWRVATVRARGGTARRDRIPAR